MKKSNSNISKFIGKQAIHETLGKVEILSRQGVSITRVQIQVIQRAPGWDEEKQSYQWMTIILNNDNRYGATIKRIRNTEHNDQFGHKDIVHINTLTLTS